MNKYAAEKLAEEYYRVGLKLALVKEAGLSKGIIKKMVQAPVAGLGGALSLVAADKLLAKLHGVPYAPVSDIGALIELSALGGGAMLGAKGGAKAFDLAHSGGSKLLNKLRR